MPRDTEPVADEELAAVREERHAQRATIREVLAENLGGEPADYDATGYLSERDQPSEPLADGDD